MAPESSENRSSENSSFGLPWSMTLALLCATGGAVMFAALYAGVCLLAGYRNEMSVLMVQHFTFIIVFTSVFSSVFTGQRFVWHGGVTWLLAQIVFIGGFYCLYFSGLFPTARSPDAPGQIWHVVTWLALGVGTSVLTSLVSASLFADSRGPESKILDSKIPVGGSSRLFYSLGAVPVFVLAVLVVTSGLFSQAPAALVHACLVSVVFFATRNSILCPVPVFRAFSLSFAMIYPLALGYFALPVIAGLEALLGRISTGLFEVDTSHYVVSAICFGLLLAAIALGGGAGLLMNQMLARQRKRES